MDCQSTQIYDDTDYLREVWILFGLGAFVLLTRTLVRLRSAGWSQFEGDDYLAFAVFACFLCDSITVTYVYLNGSNADFTPAQLQLMSQCQIEQVKLGSRMQLMAWYSYTGLIWGLKGMMLFFLNRLTFGLDEQRVVKGLAILSVAAYLAVFLTLTLGCLPFHLNWAARPKPPDRCTKKLQNLYVTTVLNVVTDALILCVPIPLIWKLRAPLSRKIALFLLLCTGAFVIVAAICRLTFTLTGVNALNVDRWGTRETFAGVVAVNVPVVRPIFGRSFWAQVYNSKSRSMPKETVNSAPQCKNRSGDVSSKPTPPSLQILRSTSYKLVGFATPDNKSSMTDIIERSHSHDSICPERSSQDNIIPDIATSESTTPPRRRGLFGSGPRSDPRVDLEQGRRRSDLGGIAVETSFDVQLRNASSGGEVPAMPGLPENVAWTKTSDRHP